MTLSTEQKEVTKEEKKQTKYLWIYERDLLELGRLYLAWRATAKRLGFTDEKIDAPPPHEDDGKLIRYMEIAEIKDIVS